ncbi:MAG: 4-hydroxy-tetrahydrodipicolinate synthase [Acidimicrobiia bacterium]|nr:4-hydroxy-tetrahydrodipicolinate synthase [Acidimicrobiia bacterium]
MAPFGEVLTAMITPFTEAGEVDYTQLWKLAEHLVANGSDGLVVSGTTGESPTLSADEKVAVFKTVVEAVGDKSTVIAGVGTYNTAHSVEMARRAAEAGCHGLLAVTPYYNKPPQEGLVRHFEAIADATDLPLMLYNIPSRSVRLIEVDTLARLAEHARIVAVKDAVEDTGFTSRTYSACGDALAIYSGADAYTLPMMAAGAVGVVSVASHLVGRQIKRMFAEAAAGNGGSATKIHHALMPLFDALFIEPNPMPLKGILNKVWGPVGDPRLPLIPASAGVVETLEAALAVAQQA